MGSVAFADLDGFPFFTDVTGQCNAVVMVEQDVSYSLGFSCSDFGTLDDAAALPCGSLNVAEPAATGETECACHGGTCVAPRLGGVRHRLQG